MGKVIVKDVLLRNQQDENVAKAGYLESDQIRETKLDMIADTGAVAVSLPESLVSQLGLEYERDVLVTVSTNEQRRIKLYGGLLVYIDGRKAYSPCLEKPEGSPYLLGQLVFEQIDYVVDCKNQQVMPNPEEVDGMMLFDDF